MIRLDENVGGGFAATSTIGEADRDDSDVLYHVTLICPTRGEAPGATGDERIYTRFGRIAADELAAHLGARWPGCPLTVEEQGPEVRQPIC